MIHVVDGDRSKSGSLNLLNFGVCSKGLFTPNVSFSVDALEWVLNLTYFEMSLQA